MSNGYQLVAKKQFDEYIRLMFSKSGKINLSPAALDSLSIIAYRQPLSRIDIEAIKEGYRVRGCPEIKFSA